MIRSAESMGPGGSAASRRRRLPMPAVALALVLAAPGLLGGCTIASEMFGEEEPAPSRVTLPAEAQGDQPFPNLGTVPDEVPQTSTRQERAALQQGLVADRDNAEYTGEPLGNRAAQAAPEAAQPAAAPAAGQAAAAPEVVPAPPPAAAPQPVQAVPPPAPAPVPSAVPSVAQPQVLEGGSVIVNPDAVLGGGPPATSRLLPSGESQPVALIFFRHGSAALSRADVAVLREAVRLHQERGGLVRVIGHASQGPASRNVARQNLANFNISLARANAVARELVRLGVGSDRIQVAAAGAQQPLYYETQPTGEAGNRRVEIYLDY